MSDKKIRDIMTKNIMAVPKNAPVSQAVKIMADHNISCVIITDDGHPVGIITERDLVKRVLGAKKKNMTSAKCSQVMTPNLITVSSESSLYDAMEIIDFRTPPRIIGPTDIFALFAFDRGKMLVPLFGLGGDTLDGRRLLIDDDLRRAVLRQM